MGKVALLYLGGVFDRLEVELRDFITVFLFSHKHLLQFLFFSVCSLYVCGMSVCLFVFVD